MPVHDRALAAALVADGPLALHERFHGFRVPPELRPSRHGELDLLQLSVGEDVVLGYAQAQGLDATVVVLFAVETRAAVQVGADAALGVCGAEFHCVVDDHVELGLVAA